MPGGQEVPMLYTIKKLVPRATAQRCSPVTNSPAPLPFQATALVSSKTPRDYPVGGTTGYDEAVALPALQTGLEGDVLFRENNNVFDVTSNKIAMEVSQVDASTGEVGGVWVSEQMADTTFIVRTNPRPKYRYSAEHPTCQLKYFSRKLSLETVKRNCVN